jgi:DNA-binding beta-propeller fold protein YncE
MPAGTWGNDVAALPGGGFLVSSTTDISDGLEKGMARMGAGEETGCVVEWTPEQGWSVLPGSAINSANGVAVTPDGGTVYVAGWRSRCVRRITRGPGGPETSEVAVDIMVDNLTWTPDGALLAAGATEATMEDFATAYFGPAPQVAFDSRILRIDASTLAVEAVAEQADPSVGVATTALQVGSELWVGAARDQGLQRYR